MQYGKKRQADARPSFSSGGRVSYRIILIVLGVSLMALIALLVQRFRQQIGTAVDIGKAGVIRERLVPFETLNPNAAAESYGAWVPIRSRILAVLPLEDQTLVSATDGLHVFDRERRHQEWRQPQQILAPGDIRAMARFQNGAVMAVSGQGLLFRNPGWSWVRPLDETARDVTALLSTPQGDLWIGTRAAGLLLWRDGRLEYAFDSEFKSTHITALAGDSLDLWIGTYDRGVMHFMHGNWKRFDRPEGLPDSQVTGIAIGQDGLAWTATPVGVAAWDDQRMAGRLLEGEFVESLASADGQVFAATLDGRIYTMSSPRRRAASLSSWDTGSASDSNRGIKLFGEGNMLLAAGGSSVWELRAVRGHAGWTPYLALPPAEGACLSDRNVSSLETDSQGRLWVGYFESGLDVVQWTGHAEHYRDDTLFCINHIRHDPRTGLTYVATANGLAIFNSDASFRVLRKEDGLPHDYISQTAAATPPSNTFYAATAAGLAIFDSRSVRSLQTFQGLASNRVYSVAVGPGELYLGTLGGVSRLSLQLSVRNYTHENSELRHNWVNAVLPVGADLWLGTYGGGIQIMKNLKEWHDPAAPLSRMHINPAALFRQGSLVFAGTLEAGFAMIHTEELRWTTITSGLPSVNITCFAADDHYLYVGSDRGVMRYKQDELQSLREEQGRR